MLSFDSLNAPQQRAVTHRGGPLVVFAGAGSGKTRVITNRVASLVADSNVPPWRVLAVTFTNKAAREMRERLRALLGDAADRLWVGTFHATCARLIRVHHQACGVRRDFVIYDDGDQKSALTRLMRDMNIDERRTPPKLIANRINWAKQEGKGPDDLNPLSAADRTFRDLYEAYEQRLARAGALDFGDLVFRLVRSMRDDADLLAALRDRYQQVLVDEFQDTDRVQFELVRELCAEHRNLCVVGDDDQSIYSWRGADRRNILDFHRSFEDATMVKLEQNYRSSQRIVRAASAIIARNVDRQPKTLWTDNPLGQPIRLVCCWDERGEAEMLVRSVREFEGRGLGLSHMALLYRTHAQSRAFEEKLRTANLPYQVLGGMRFYERAEVKDALSYLRVLLNPDDDVSLLRVLNTPPRGIGKSTIERLLDQAAQSGRSVWSTVERAPDEPGFGAAAKKRLSEFASLIRSLNQLSQEQSPAALTDEMLKRAGYIAWLQGQDSVEADTRLENLRELVGSIQDFEDSTDTGQEDQHPTLAEFLERVTLETAVDGMQSEECLTLMTVHAAKGLEFPVVFVAGLEEQLFPNRGVGPDADEDELEEERRLAYVAFTRARERLILSHALQRRIYGDLRERRRSRFLDEIPADDLENLGVNPNRAQSSQARYGGQSRLGWGSSGWSQRQPTPVARSDDSYVDRSEGCDPDPDESGIRPGMKVRHKRFGIGRVRAVSPESPPKITVVFPGMAPKRIQADYLEPE